MEKIFPVIDIAFKKIFGVEENKDLLISLINSIVSPEDHVKEVFSDQDFRCQKSGHHVFYETLKEARNNFERSFIISKLEENEWNISKTAECIGLERSHLHRKLRLLDIEALRRRF